MKILVAYAILLGLVLPAKTSYSTRKCPCTFPKLWLDIVIAVDNSADEGIKQISDKITSTFNDLIIAQGEGQHSRVGVITYASEAEINYGLDRLRSTEELLEGVRNLNTVGSEANITTGLAAARETLAFGRGLGMRRNVRTAIVLYAADYREEDEETTEKMADLIKAGGTDIIVVAVDLGDKTKLNALKKLKKVATPGYLFMSTASDLRHQVQHALCMTNCFCKGGWYQYANITEDSTIKYGECLKPAIIDACWNAAKRSCRKSGNGKGYLANEFDLDKHKFISATFKEHFTISPPYMYHIGLSYNAKKGQFYWEQPIGSEPLPLEEGSFTRWNRGYPLAKNLLENNRCVLNAQTSTAFNLFWQNENCKSVPRRYVCQMNSCDTDNYCESYKFHS